MQHRLGPRRLVSLLASVLAAGFLSGCGGGGSVDVGVGVGGGGGVPVINIALTAVQIAPRTVQLNWGNDPAAAFFRVRGEGTPLADVNATAYIDTTVYAGYTYCWDVAGYDGYGTLTAVSNTVCLLVV